jgi:hypothetical protein
MSGVLGGLLLLWPLWIWLGWAFCTWLVYLVWRMFRPLDKKRVVAQIIFGVVLFGSWLSWSLWELGLKKVYWDTQVNRMCAVDGGVTVYEQVKLSKDKFDKYGYLNFYHPAEGEYSLGENYRFIRAITYIRRDDPELFRMYTKIYRRSDNKLLGESVFYSRGGGDIPGSWQSSSYMCPKMSIEADVIRQVFIKEDV